MRYSLLLITAFTMPAHAELHERSVISNHTSATSTSSYNLTSNSGLFAEAFCWLPTSLTDKGQSGGAENCLVEAIQGSVGSIQNLAGIFDTSSSSWPSLSFPAVGNSTWSFIADISYQFLLKSNSGDQLGKHLETPANAAPLASMPLATVTWFVLGGMLGSLALTRRRLTNLAMVKS